MGSGKVKNASDQQRSKMLEDLEAAFIALHNLPLRQTVMALRRAYRLAWMKNCTREYRGVMIRHKRMKEALEKEKESERLKSFAT